jgi:hypothetical protein
MKPICVLALGAVVVGCHLDKLLTGSGGPHPTSTAPPVALVFMAKPQNAQAGQKINPAVQVSVVDSAGVPVAGADTATIIIELGANPPGNATLGGTTTAHPSRGVATFGNLWIDKAGDGYTLIAHVSGLPDSTSQPFNITPPPLTTGSITVTTSTTGLDLDLDGYTVTVDGTTSQSIATNSGNAGVTFPGLSVGNHGVVLSSVAANCSVTGGNSRTASVTAGQTDTVAFSVSCTLIPPTTGTLTVTTSTTGSDLDPDGYTVTVDGTNSQAIGDNSNGVTFPGLSAASHTVELTGVASNCTVSGTNPRNVTVVAGSGGSTAFAVTCAAPPSGSLTVSTTTNGPNPPSGYTVTVDAGSSQPVGATGSVTFSNLSVATHSVSLSPIPSNCTVSGPNPQTVSITANNTTPASFTINCTGTTGDLTVTTTTGGSDLDPDGYTVSVGGSSQPIPTNGSVTFRGLQAGTQSVALSGIASNCTVSGANPITVTVPAGGVGHADFAISCVALPPPVVTAGGDQTVLIGALFQLSGASFSDQDHDGPWTVTIDWGDGGSDTFAMTTEGAISGSHSYHDLLLATHKLTITVVDAHSGSGTASKTVNVVASLP